MGYISKEKKVILLALFLTLALGITLRFFYLGKFGLSFDESLTALQVKHIGRINFFKNILPPFYIYFLHFFTGHINSEFAWRFPSLIFGSFSIILMFFLGRMLFNEKIGLISAFLVSISPFQIYYSQTARPYSMMGMLSLLSVFFLVKSFRKGTFLYWLGFIMFSLIAIYCHYMAMLIWGAQLIFFFLVRKDLSAVIKRKWYISNLLLFLFVAPLSTGFLNITGKLREIKADFNIPFWGPIVSFRSLFMTVKNFSIGYNADMVIHLFAIGVFSYFFLNGVLKFKKEKEMILCLLCLFAPILTAFVASLFQSCYIDRFFLPSSLFYLFIVATGLSSLKNKHLVLFVLIISILSGCALRNYYCNVYPLSAEKYPWEQRKRNYKAVADYINGRRKEGESLYHACRNTIYPYLYYSDKLNGKLNQLNDSNVFLHLDRKINRLRALEMGISYDDHRMYDIDLAKEKEKIWLILSSWHFEKRALKDLEGFALLKWLKREFKIVEEKSFDCAKVFFLKKK